MNPPPNAPLVRSADTDGRDGIQASVLLPGIAVCALLVAAGGSLVAEALVDHNMSSGAGIRNPALVSWVLGGVAMYSAVAVGTGLRDVLTGLAVEVGRDLSAYILTYTFFFTRWPHRFLRAHHISLLTTLMVCVLSLFVG